MCITSVGLFGLTPGTQVAVNLVTCDIDPTIRGIGLQIIADHGLDGEAGCVSIGISPAAALVLAISIIEAAFQAIQPAEPRIAELHSRSQDPADAGWDLSQCRIGVVPGPRDSHLRAWACFQPDPKHELN